MVAHGTPRRADHAPDCRTEEHAGARQDAVDAHATSGQRSLARPPRACAVASRRHPARSLEASAALTPTASLPRPHRETDLPGPSPGGLASRARLRQSRAASACPRAPVTPLRERASRGTQTPSATCNRARGRTPRSVGPPPQRCRSTEEYARHGRAI